MSNNYYNPAAIDGLIEGLIQSYREHPRMQHLDSPFLPNRDHIIHVLEDLRRVIFPGFFDHTRLTSDMIDQHVGELLTHVGTMLYEQVRQALRYEQNVKEPGAGEACDDCDQQARQLTTAFLQQLREVRRKLSLDVHASFEGDPAAVNTDETVFCYPGLYAIFTHRVAHVLHELGVPLIPRIMAEHAHNLTGIEIHPGARIGESFFIDHGTGVVIGETTEIGDRVKLYQGVTLGALSTKGGQAWRGRKRHPTIEDDVTIYGGSIILGGDTVIGKGATIGGSLFITESVPAGHMVTMRLPDLKMRPPRENEKATSDRGNEGLKL